MSPDIENVVEQNSSSSENSNEIAVGKKQTQFVRSPNWSIEEVRVLCKYVADKYIKMFGISGQRKGTTAVRKLHWLKVTKEINEISAQDRQWKQVRKKWQDLYYAAKNRKRKPKLVDDEILNEFRKAWDELLMSGLIQDERSDTGEEDTNSSSSGSQPLSPCTTDDSKPVSSPDNNFKSANVKKLVRKKRPYIETKRNRKRLRKNNISLHNESSSSISISDLTISSSIEDLTPRKLQNDRIVIEKKRLLIEKEKLLIMRENVAIKNKKLLIMRENVAIKNELLDTNKSILNCFKDISKCMKIYVRNCIDTDSDIK